MANQFDLIVIGGGPGGYVAAIRASQLGLKTAVVERENLGGICLNWGCIPTKALLKSAEVFEYLNHASDYGFSVQNIGVDFPGVINRSRSVADGMSKGVQFLFRKNKIEHIKGTAKLTPDKKVEVTDPTGAKSYYSAPHVIIATGARARQLPGMECDDRLIIEYRRALTLPQQPKSMLVMGSGAIGSEFAYFYNALGTKVTLVEYLDRILPLEDAEVSKTMQKLFQNKGIDVRPSSKVVNVKKNANSITATIESGGKTTELEADILLSAVGVVANIENIGLESLGIQVENGKIKTDDYYRTNVPGFYAIGDCTKGPALAHVASAEGIICVEKIAGHHPQPMDYNNIPNCTYCQPEVASVGYTEEQAKAQGYEVSIGKFPFSASGKASAAGKKDGFIKLVIDKKYGEVLGAHMVGAGVTDMIAEIVVARKLETTVREIIHSVHPHPTMSEAVMEAAAAAVGEVIHL
jgi:dihydrolipoamide dehydrogenase